MDLIVHEVMQLHDVHNPDGHLLIERHSRSAIVKGHLPRHGKPGLSQQVEGLLLRRAVKDRRS